MKKLFFLTTFAILFFQCINKEKPVEPITFTPHTFSKSSAFCNQGDSSLCARVDADYVLVEGGSAEVRQIINDSILHFVGYSFQFGDEVYNADKGLEGAADKFILGYDTIADKEGASMSQWAIKSSLYNVADYDSLLSFGLSSYNYTGGAHGNYFAVFLNFNKNTGKTIRVTDVFKDYNALSPYLEHAARAYYQNPEEQSLKDFGFYYDGEAFPVNNNFCMMKDTVMFIYNPYEIAPYVMGQMDLRLAKKDIAALMK